MGPYLAAPGAGKNLILVNLWSIWPYRVLQLLGWEALMESLETVIRTLGVFRWQ